AALTFVVAAFLVLQIPRDRVTPCEATSSLAGVRVVARDPRLRVLVGVLSASTLIEGMVDVLVVVIALQLVDLGDGGVGWLNAAWGVGGVIGGAFARGRGLRLGCVLVGTPLIALALVPNAVTALV